MNSNNNSKPPILFIHGMYVNHWVWSSYVHLFENQGFKCITPDLRYHSMIHHEENLKKLGKTSIFDYVDDLEKEIAKLDQKPIIIGHSLGGLITQKLAAKKLAKAIILLTPVPPRGISSFKINTIMTFLRTTLTKEFWRKPIYFTWKEAIYSSLNLCPQKLREEIFSKFFYYESGRVFFETAFPFLDKNKTTAVNEANVDCPALIIGAKKDRIIVPGIIKKMAKKYNAEFKIFEKHAHYIILEPYWDDIARYIIEWLEAKKLV